MSLLERFDSPAYLPDFSRIPGQPKQWHKRSLAVLMNQECGEQEGTDEHVQFYNPAKFDPDGPIVEQDIPWSAFPKELVREYGYERALREADMLWPLTRYTRRNIGTILERRCIGR